MSERTFLKRWLGVSLIFHLITAWFSIGYQAADEHFQILEFLSYKLGGAPAYDLPIEFGEHMRPWLQIGIYKCIVQVLQWMQILNPHYWAFAMRLWTGLVGWLSLVGLALCCRIWFTDLKTRKIAILALSLLWYFPVLHVRPSSESLAGSAFTLGLSLLVLTWKPLAAGLSPQNFLSRSPLFSYFGWYLGGCFLGLSFEARFQSALMIAGTLLWFLCIARIQWRALLAISCGLLSLFILGRVIDYWGYGAWTLSPWNYFSYNLIRGEVSRFGQSPWWDIYRMSLTESWPIIGLLLSLSVTWAWFKYPKHILTWSQLPFALVHMFIAHKEYRFFFPMGGAAALLAVLSVSTQSQIRLPQLQSWKRGLWMSVGSILILLNFSGLCILSFIPVSRLIQYQEAVSGFITPGEEFRLYSLNGDPFTILGNPTYFYRPKELKITHIPAGSTTPITADQYPLWYYELGLTLSAQAQTLLGPGRCHLVFSTLPSWVVEVLRPTGLLDRIHVLSLHRCD